MVLDSAGNTAFGPGVELYDEIEGNPSPRASEFEVKFDGSGFTAQLEARLRDVAEIQMTERTINFGGVPPPEAERQKSYQHLKSTLALELSATVQVPPQSSTGFQTIQSPVITRIPRLPRECQKYVRGGQYRPVGSKSNGFESLWWIHDQCSGLLQGASVKGGGTLTYLWFIPGETNTFQINFQDLGTVSVEITRK